MASGNDNVERIKLEAKKELVRSIKGLQSYVEKSCGTVSVCQNPIYENSYKFRKICGKKCEQKFKVQGSDIPVLAKLMAQLPIYCKYEKNGCQGILMKEDMIDHEEVCVYRPINCADLKCTQKFIGMDSSHGLMEHLTEVHKGLDVIEKKKFLITTKIGADLKSAMLATTQISAFNFTFFEVGVITDQFMFRWIYILADANVAKNFFYDVTIKNQNTGEKLNYFGQVRSLSEHDEDITESFKAFFVPNVRVEEFMDADSKLVLEYQIRNMKDEAKDDNEESGISDDNE